MTMDEYEGGATRDSEEGKIDPEGALSPRVLARYCKYMLKHTETENGTRNSDNWQGGIDPHRLMRSWVRHTLSLWTEWRAGRGFDQDLACAVLFNIMTMLHQELEKGTVQRNEAGHIEVKRDTFGGIH